jgi:oxygen-independent coproporphyrinogen-3 oxidase
MTISPETFARYAALKVPRYTSYPTAPNFSASVGEADYLRWLADLTPGGEVSIYLHVPFCNAMCWYCGCHTSVTRRREPVERYVRALSDEIVRVAGALPGRMKVRHLHWGGGSPTLLSAGDFARLNALTRRYFDFAAGAELAIEIDPRTLELDLAAELGKCGITRASLGVQSFDPKVQQAINRVQTIEQTAAATILLRNAGIGALNFDLIYGLPFQTMASCLETVSRAIEMRPDRLAVFGYAHVPDLKPHQRRIDENALPGTEERHAQSQSISEALVRAGYRQIGLDHFALPSDSLSLAAETGTLHRNFQGYTTDPCDTLLGFGASAISKLPNGFTQNAPNIPEYQERVGRSGIAVARGCGITREDRKRAAIIERLMCDFRADTLGIQPQGLDQLEADGLISRKGNEIALNDRARPLVRAVAAAFDSRLTKASHVPAV